MHDMIILFRADTVPIKEIKFSLET